MMEYEEKIFIVPTQCGKIQYLSTALVYVGLTVISITCVL